MVASANPMPAMRSPALLQLPNARRSVAAFFLFGSLMAVSARPISAATATLQPSKDNTIYGEGNANLSNGAGIFLFAGSSGTNGGGRTLRSLIAFNLSQIPADAMTPRDSQLQFGLLNISSQLEAIGDVIEKSICGPVLVHARNDVRLHPEDEAALDALYQKVLRRFETAISVLATRDRALARQ